MAQKPRANCSYVRISVRWATVIREAGLASLSRIRVRHPPDDAQHNQLCSSDCNEMVEKNYGEHNLNNGEDQGGSANGCKPLLRKDAVAFIPVFNCIEASDIARVRTARI